MASQVTPLTVNAVALGLTLDEMGLAARVGDHVGYASARSQAEQIMRNLGLTSTLPTDSRIFVEDADSSYMDEFLTVLDNAKMRPGGDKFATPLFVIATSSSALIISIAAGEPDRQLEMLFRGCLNDLGLDPQLLDQLHSRGGLLRAAPPRVSGPEDVYAAMSQLSRVAYDFSDTVLKEFARIHPSTGPLPVDQLTFGGAQLSAESQELLWAVNSELAGMRQELGAIRGVVGGVREDVAAFRAEYRATSERLEQLIKAGDPEIRALLDKIVEQMVQRGVDPRTAERATADEPKGLLDRIGRWLEGGAPAGPIESAMWAALDCVPGGTGVKLGLAVLKAVRHSLQ